MIDKDKVYLDIAENMARFSKCRWYKVGAIIVKEGRIISTGYNGTPSKFPHECSSICGKIDKQFAEILDKDLHHTFTELQTIHAEMNALLFAARHGLSVEYATLYCTLHPCQNCLKAIVAAGITRICYENEYDKMDLETQKLAYDFCLSAQVSLSKYYAK